MKAVALVVIEALVLSSWSNNSDFIYTALFKNKLQIALQKHKNIRNNK